DPEPALHLADDGALDGAIALEGLLDLAPHLELLGLLPRQEDLARLGVRRLEVDVDLVALLDRDPALARAELGDGDLPLGLVPDVDRDGIARRTQRGVRTLAVAPVARRELACERRLVDRLAAGAELDGPPPRALGGRRGEEELGGRLREDDGADVPSLHHDAARPGERSLERNEPRAHDRPGGDARRELARLGTADRLREVAAADEQPLAVPGDLEREPGHQHAERLVVVELD